MINLSNESTMNSPKEPPSKPNHEFAQAMQEVQPISHNQASLDKPKPSARANFTRSDEHQVLLEAMESDIEDTELESGDVIFYTRPGVQKRILNKLRKGDYKIERVCDLHGETLASAKELLLDFMHECERDNIRCVRIIHGKGKRSGHKGPVIKPKLNRWLRVWDHVLAFHSARIVDGGTGAVYVLLRNKK